MSGYDHAMHAAILFKPRPGTTQIFFPVEFGEVEIKGWMMTVQSRQDDRGYAGIGIRDARVPVEEFVRYRPVERTRIDGLISGSFASVERLARSKLQEGVME